MRCYENNNVGSATWCGRWIACNASMLKHTCKHKRVLSFYACVMFLCPYFLLPWSLPALSTLQLCSQCLGVPMLLVVAQRVRKTSPRQGNQVVQRGSVISVPISNYMSIVLCSVCTLCVTTKYLYFLSLLVTMQ